MSVAAWLWRLWGPMPSGAHRRRLIEAWSWWNLHNIYYGTAEKMPTD